MANPAMAPSNADLQQVVDIYKTVQEVQDAVTKTEALLQSMKARQEEVSKTARDFLRNKPGMLNYLSESHNAHQPLETWNLSRIADICKQELHLRTIAPGDHAISFSGGAAIRTPIAPDAPASAAAARSPMTMVNETLTNLASEVADAMNEHSRIDKGQFIRLWTANMNDFVLSHKPVHRAQLDIVLKILVGTSISTQKIATFAKNCGYDIVFLGSDGYELTLQSQRRLAAPAPASAAEAHRPVDLGLAAHIESICRREQVNLGREIMAAYKPSFSTLRLYIQSFENLVEMKRNRPAEAFTREHQIREMLEKEPQFQAYYAKDGVMPKAKALYDASKADFEARVTQWKQTNEGRKAYQVAVDVTTALHQGGYCTDLEKNIDGAFEHFMIYHFEGIPFADHRVEGNLSNARRALPEATLRSYANLNGYNLDSVRPITISLIK